MEIALYPGDCSESLATALVLAGIEVTPTFDLTPEAASDWSVLVIELGDEPMRRLRMLEWVTEVGLPVLLVAEADQLGLLEKGTRTTDLIVAPLQPAELGLRIRRMAKVAGGEEIFRFKDLELNTLTYQAVLGISPLDLTFMEYELLRFFVDNQGRVWSREQLLSRVWGYEYYGGARTVDVHVRRLRAKLGEERSSWITTVRSVGYRFG
jgi:DNA-binding response OmpR family regulator